VGGLRISGLDAAKSCLSHDLSARSKVGTWMRGRGRRVIKRANSGSSRRLNCSSNGSRPQTRGRRGTQIEAILAFPRRGRASWMLRTSVHQGAAPRPWVHAPGLLAHFGLESYRRVAESRRLARRGCSQSTLRCRRRVKFSPALCAGVLYRS